MFPELPLTLSDAVPGSAANMDHVVCVEHAQLLLALGQSLDLAAQGRGVGRIGQHELLGVVDDAVALQTNCPETEQRYYL